MRFINTLRKRGLALLLAILMCLSMMPTGALAVGDEFMNDGTDEIMNSDSVTPKGEGEDTQHEHNEGGWVCELGCTNEDEYHECGEDCPDREWTCTPPEEGTDLEDEEIPEDSISGEPFSLPRFSAIDQLDGFSNYQVTPLATGTPIDLTGTPVPEGSSRVFVYLKLVDEHGDKIENPEQWNANKEGYYTIGYIDVPGLISAEDSWTLENTFANNQTRTQAVNYLTDPVNLNKLIRHPDNENREFNLSTIQWDGSIGKWSSYVQFGLKKVRRATDYTLPNNDCTWHLDGLLRLQTKVTLTVTYEFDENCGGNQSDLPGEFKKEKIKTGSTVDVPVPEISGYVAMLDGAPVEGSGKDSTYSYGPLMNDLKKTIIYHRDINDNDVPDCEETFSGTVTMSGWTYGDAATSPQWTFKLGNVSLNQEPQITYQSKVTGSTASSDKPTNAGEYTVKATWALPNGETVEATDDFTIAKRPLTLKSVSLEKEYDGTPLNNEDYPSSPQVRKIDSEDVVKGGLVIEEGWVNSEGANVTYTFRASPEATKQVVQQPGDERENYFVINASADVLANYNIIQQYGKLKIVNRTNKYTISLTVKDVSKVYDGNQMTFGGFEGATDNSITTTLDNGKTYTVDVTPYIGTYATKDGQPI